MTLHLTNVAPVREPGFSRSEALDLARRIERSSLPSFGLFDLRYMDDFEPFTESERHVVVAALPAYANG